MTKKNNKLHCCQVQWIIQTSKTSDVFLQFFLHNEFVTQQTIRHRGHKS